MKENIKSPIQQEDITEEKIKTELIKKIEKFKVIGITAEECKCCLARNKILDEVISLINQEK